MSLSSNLAAILACTIIFAPTVLAEETVMARRQFHVPDELLADSPHGRFPGDLRIGDLQNDGKLGFVAYRSIGGAQISAIEGLKPCFIGAFTPDGKVLWIDGKPGSGQQPTRPGPVTIFDLDADGRSDVLNFWHRPELAPDTPTESMADVVIQLRDAATGKVKRESRPEIFRSLRGAGANWVHQRLLIANFRGLPTPRDFCVKIGDHLLAFTDTLELLWSYRIAWNQYSRCSAYIPAVGDIDGDGRDEVTGGYFLLDHRGCALWEDPTTENMDSVAIAPWRDGVVRAIGSGYGQVRDRAGTLVLNLGKEIVPHGQEMRLGQFISDQRKPQLAIRHLGHKPDLILVNTDGKILRRMKLNSSPNETGMEMIRWHGAEGPDLLYNGGMLWDLDRETSRPLTDLPPTRGHERMGWWHAVPADYSGRGREELFVYNPWMPDFYFYAPAPLDEARDLRCPRTARFANVRLMD